MTANALACWGVSILMASADTPPETLRYVRPAGNKFATECTFVIARQPTGWTITSRTDRGAVKMAVEARYDAEERLAAAKAVLTTEGKSKTANVEVKDGKATVKREGEKPVEFEVPKGTIVTSAPDWTDVFLLCRLYDREKKGKQEFPALWIHPIQPAQRLTFSIERQGTDGIETDGKKMELARYLIRIRNNSGYVAWADAKGRMIRLVPLPFKEPGGGLTLEGFEKAAAGLRPKP